MIEKFGTLFFVYPASRPPSHVRQETSCTDWSADVTCTSSYSSQWDLFCHSHITATPSAVTPDANKTHTPPAFLSHTHTHTLTHSPCLCVVVTYWISLCWCAWLIGGSRWQLLKFLSDILRHRRWWQHSSQMQGHECAAFNLILYNNVIFVFT